VFLKTLFTSSAVGLLYHTKIRLIVLDTIPTSSTEKPCWKWAANFTLVLLYRKPEFAVHLVCWRRCLSHVGQNAERLLTSAIELAQLNKRRAPKLHRKAARRWRN